MRPIDADDLDNVVLQLNKEGRTITRNEYKILDNIIFEFATIEVEPVRHGQWVDPASLEWYRCSVCEEYVQQPMPKLLYHYCPHCGARMDGGK